MGQSKNRGQSQQRTRFMLTSPHDPITDPKSAAKMPFVPILLGDTQTTQEHGHGSHVPSSPNNFKVGQGRSNNVNGPRPRAPYTPTRPAPPPPPTAGRGGHHQAQYPHQPQGHFHQYKLMEVVPVPAPSSAQHGQPSPGDPGFVFRPATEPAVPPVSTGPEPDFQVPQSPVFTFQPQPLVLHNGPEGSFFEGIGTLWILNVEQLDETGQSNLTQENSQIDSSEERSKEKPPAWDKLNCIFCRSNGEPPSVYKNHHLRDDQNKTVCPILMKYTCPVCKKTGEEAHTLKYCPQKLKKGEVTSASASASPNVRTGNNTQRVKNVLSSTGRSYRRKY